MMTLSSLSSSNVRILAEISEGLINFIFLLIWLLAGACRELSNFFRDQRGGQGALMMIGHSLVYVTYWADIASEDEKRTRKDI